MLLNLHSSSHSNVLPCLLHTHVMTACPDLGTLELLFIPCLGVWCFLLWLHGSLVCFSGCTDPLGARRYSLPACLCKPGALTSQVLADHLQDHSCMPVTVPVGHVHSRADEKLECNCEARADQGCMCLHAH